MNYLQIILRIYNHFNGYKIGKLKRRHIKVDKIRYIGKESNNLEETEIFGVDKETYAVYRSCW